MSRDVVDLHDPRWFPADLDMAGRRIALLRIDERVVEQSTFMDNRLEADSSQAVVLDEAAVDAWQGAAAAPAWLFHTSFCCSTLLARALSAPPEVMVYREPLLLRRLADARHEQRALLGWIERSVRLLSRPWIPDGRVLIKPTHAALNIAADLMRCTPESRSLVLTSSLDDFLESNVKKTPETQSRIPLLVERALRAGQWHARLPEAAFAPPSLIAAAGLQWAAQRELLASLARVLGSGRIRVFDASDLLADVPAMAWNAAEWLRLPINADMLHEHSRQVATRHAKAEARAYDHVTRAAEAALIRSTFREELSRARAWLDTHVLPVMSRDALELPSGSFALARS